MGNKYRYLVIATVAIVLLIIATSGVATMGTPFQVTSPTPKLEIKPTPTYVIVQKPTATPTPVPTTIEVTLSKDYVMADGKDLVTVTARVLDQHGSPVPDGTIVNFMIDDAGWKWPAGGTLANPGSSDYGFQYMNGFRTKNGVATVEYGKASELNADQAIKITAKANDNTNVKSSATVNVRAIKIADLHLSRGYVVANGTDFITVSAVVTDSQGHPVTDGTPVDFGIEDSAWHYQEGSLSTNDVWQGLQFIHGVRTVGGVAKVNYGFASPESADTRAYINVSLRENKAIYKVAGVKVSAAASAETTSPATETPTASPGDDVTVTPAADVTVTPEVTVTPVNDTATPTPQGQTDAAAVNTSSSGPTVTPAPSKTPGMAWESGLVLLLVAGFLLAIAGGKRKAE